MYTKLFRVSVIALLVGLLFTTGSAQQPSPQIHAVLSYIKVLPGQGAAYETQLKSDTKKFYQELMAVDSSVIAWSSARVMYRGMEGQDFDYVGALVSNGPPAEPGRNMDAIYAKLGTTQAEYQKRLAAMRVVVGTEVLRRMAGTSATGVGVTKEGDFRVMNQIRVKAGMGSEFSERTTTLQQPMMQEAVAQGDFKAWSMWTRLFPGGAATAYDMLAVTTYKDLASAISPAPDPNRGATRFMKANPGKSYASYLTNGTDYSESQRRMVAQIVAMVERAVPMKTSENR